MKTLKHFSKCTLQCFPNLAHIYQGRDRKGKQIFSFKHLYFALWAEYESRFWSHYIFVRLVRKTSGNFHSQVL